MFSARSAVVLLVLSLIVLVLFLYIGRKETALIINPVPTPTPYPDIVTIQSQDEVREASEVRTPDGKVKLIMEKTATGDSAYYSFSVQEEDRAKNEIFSKTVPSNISFEMSPNAWSPDNKYFFIIEKSGDSTNYFVFRADGEYFQEEEQYINVLPVFNAKDTGYSLLKVTGWASPALLYLLTGSERGGKGPAYWFEIPSKAVIRLADR
jgi:hypothetical protein